MTFKGHLAGGILIGIAVASGASHLGCVPPGDQRLWAGVCATAVFFSLFPDLDTSSVPQRWFFRVVFAALLYLGWSARYELGLVVAVLAMLPVVDHHRGWTHWKISPLIVPAFLGALYEYWHVRRTWPGASNWSEVGPLLEGHLVFLAACVLGWYTHLLLDGCFRVFPVERGHH